MCPASTANPIKKRPICGQIFSVEVMGVFSSYNLTAKLGILRLPLLACSLR
jgi:hypothetical protein